MVEHAQLLRLRALTQALFAAVTLLAMAPSLRSQEEPDLEQSSITLKEPDADGMWSFSMNESNGMPLVEFVKWAQVVTKKRFTYTATELANGSGAAGNTVSFLGTFRIPEDRWEEDFFSFFQTMLYIKGFAVVPRGEGDLEMLEIVMMQGQRGREVTNGARYVTPDELAKYRFQTGVPILTTVPLKHINA